jgi:hypothetical protein
LGVPGLSDLVVEAIAKEMALSLGLINFLIVKKRREIIEAKKASSRQYHNGTETRLKKLEQGKKDVPKKKTWGMMLYTKSGRLAWLHQPTTS